MSRGVFACVLIGMVAAGAAGQPVLRVISVPQGLSDYRGLAISSDGTRALWILTTSSSTSSWLWTNCGARSQLLDGLPGTSGVGATALSGDGGTVVGFSTMSQSSTTVSFRWNTGAGVQPLEGLVGSVSTSAYDVNFDGGFVVGSSALGNSARALRWTPSGGAEDLGVLGTGTRSAAYAVSDDGMTVAGVSDDLPGGSEWVPKAFRWTPTTGMQPLVLWPGVINSYAHAISGDGNVIVGRCVMPTGEQRSFRWTLAAGPEVLTPLAGASLSLPLCCSHDGGVVGGFAITASGEVAVIWTGSTQGVRAYEYLTDLGVDTTGWVLQRVYGLSTSGTSMTGCGTFNGEPVAWVLTAPGLASQSPSIVSQPLGSSVPIGGTGGVSVEADSTVVQHRWLRNGAALSESARIVGTTTPALTIAGFQSSDQGVYTCVVTNPCGDTTSDGAELSCRASVGVQPVGGSFLSGADIQLAPVLSTSGATSYRWKKDNFNLFNSGAYSGVTTPTLTIHANDPSQSGSYTLAITNPCGVTTTAPAVVGVSCAADWNGDGGVDGDDVIAFMFLWDSGDAGADFNADGGVDGDDVIGFFGRWDSGC